jgi:hypothetical protein
VKLDNLFRASTNLPRKSRSTNSEEPCGGAVVARGGVAVLESTLCQEEAVGNIKFAALVASNARNGQSGTKHGKKNLRKGSGKPGGGRLVLGRLSLGVLTFCEARFLRSVSGGARGDLGALVTVDVLCELDLRRPSCGLARALPAVATTGILERPPLVVLLKTGLEDEPDVVFEVKPEVRSEC